MRTLLSGTQHALRAGDYEAVISSVGASLRSLTFDGRDLTVPFDADEVRPSYRGATLAPWPNRIVDGLHTFAGVERQVALTEPARVSPHRLVLLDEIEKASKEAVRLLLQVTSDGRLTDGMGRTVSFADTLVVATSNARADILREALSRGESVASLEGYLRARLTDVFPPELLNRFTRIVIFRDLSPDHLKRIASETVRQIGALALTKYGVTVQADEAALGEIVKRGYDPQYGARPLRRAAESALDSVLAPLLISNALARGAIVTLTFENGAFVIR